MSTDCPAKQHRRAIVQLKDRLRELRLKAGLTLRELEEHTGLSHSYLSALENGRANPAIRSAATIAGALGLSLVELLQGVDFAGELREDAEPLPAGLRELVEHPDFRDGLDEGWVELLRGIHLRGERLTAMEDWLTVYLVLRRVFGE
jgi:transcriptional regulator with XRE-family HTH domain